MKTPPRCLQSRIYWLCEIAGWNKSEAELLSQQSDGITIQQTTLDRCWHGGIPCLTLTEAQYLHAETRTNHPRSSCLTVSLCEKQMLAWLLCHYRVWCRFVASCLFASLLLALRGVDPGAEINVISPCTASDHPEKCDPKNQCEIAQVKPLEDMGD